MVSHDTPPSTVAGRLPVAPVSVLTRPLARFLAVESAGGVVLIVCTLLALILANSAAAIGWAHLWDTPVSIRFGDLTVGGELGHFVVNDVLMTIFFFVVGLEIKRELVTGELRDPRKAALPVAAALGGMVIPAGICLVLLHGQPGARGWGVPMATDIAFVVGVMALLGPRLPAGLKVMLLSLAIADDIGAVIVIAALYSTSLNWLALAVAVLGLGVVYVLKRLGVRAMEVYVLCGCVVWLAVYKSGVHPTIAGVALGLMTPCAAWVGKSSLRLALSDLLGQFSESGNDEIAPHDLTMLSFAAREAVSPQERLEPALHPWVGFVIMPLFALANAGVVIDPSVFLDPVTVAVGLGLLLGKPVGVILFSILAVRFGLARLPEGVNWRMVVGGGFLAGIGFTMSLFVAGLAFPTSPHFLSAAKVGTLGGSLFSAVIGAAILLWAMRNGERDASHTKK